MYSKNLYFNIVLRVFFIVLMSCALSYFIVIGRSFRFSIICIVFIVLLTYQSYLISEQH